MSKKSRRRNKKILGLLGAIGLGLAAKNRRNKAIDTGIQSAEDDKGSDMMEFKEQVVSAPIAKPVVKSVPLGKMRGTGSDEAAITGQNKRAAYAQSMRAGLSEPTSINVDMAEGSPMIDNPYNSRKIRGRLINRAFKSGGRAKLKSGGKVKGCGKALRGFGRAMKKGKK